MATVDSEWEIKKDDVQKSKRIVGRESDFLNELVADCMYHNLTDEQSLLYIKKRFKKEITKGILWHRREDMNKEESNIAWLSSFAKVGFVVEQRQMISKIKKLIDYSMNSLFMENLKPYVKYKKQLNMNTQEWEDTNELLPSMPHELKNDFKILRLQNDIRDSMRLYKELLEITPLIAEQKAEIQKQLDLKLKLLQEYGITVTEDGELLQQRNQESTRQSKGDIQSSTVEDPRAVF